MNWNDVTIKNFYRLKRVLDMPEDEDKVYRIVGALNGKSLEAVLSMNIRDVEKMIKDADFVNRKPRARMAQRKYIINGTTYLPTYDMTNITTAQYIDFQAKAPFSETDMAGFLAVLMIPEGHKYNDGYDMNKVLDDMGCLGVEDAMGLSAFFFFLYKALMKQAERSLRRMLRKAQKKGEMTKEQVEAVQKAMSAIELLDGLNA